MKLKEKIYTVLITGFCIFNLQVSGQTYSIESFEGTKQSVTIENDCDNRKFQVIYATDTLCVFDNYYCEITVKALNKNFLEIFYECAGGSGVQNKKLLIICVKDKKLQVPLNFLAQSLYYEGDGLASSYDVKLSLKKTDKSITLLLAIHDMFRPQGAPKKSWHNYHKSIELSFDSEKNVFYNIRKTLHQQFTIRNLDDDKDIDLSFTGSYPAINLNRAQFYFINNIWYEVGRYEPATRTYNMNALYQNYTLHNN